MSEDSLNHFLLVIARRPASSKVTEQIEHSLLAALRGSPHSPLITLGSQAREMSIVTPRAEYAAHGYLVEITRSSILDFHSTIL